MCFDIGFTRANFRYNIAQISSDIDIAEYQISVLTSENSANKAQISELKTQLEETKAMSDVLTDLGEYTITCYCNCVDCCGSWAYVNAQNTYTVGAANEPLIEGISCAAFVGSGATLELGSKIYIEGIGVRIVQDTGPDSIFARYDNKLIDVYCSSHERAAEIGKQSRKVWLINE